MRKIVTIGANVVIVVVVVVMRSTLPKTPKVYIKYADNYEVSKMKILISRTK